MKSKTLCDVLRREVYGRKSTVKSGPLPEADLCKLPSEGQRPSPSDRTRSQPMETLGATRDVLDVPATAAGPETRVRGSWPVADGAQQGFPGSSARLGCASRAAKPPPHPVHAATPPAAHLALADAEDAAAAAQAHARAPGLRGRAAEGEGAA